MGAASLVGSVMPVVPFGLWSRGAAIAVALAAGVVGLFLLGAIDREGDHRSSRS